MSAVTGVGVDSSTAIESVYVVRGDVSPDAITRSLQALLPTRHHAIVRRRLSLLDTFDGRIRRAGARLTKRGRSDAVTVGWQRGGTTLTVQLKEPVGFAWDLPAGPLQQAVAPVIGVRRLLAQADTELHGSLLDVLDDRRKTTARLRIESGRARLPTARSAWQPLPSVITLTGLRGYEDIYDRLVPVIESRPGVEACPEGFNVVALRGVGALPPAVPPPGADLVPTVLAEAGARYIHQALLGIMVANEPGLRANLDTEFLHDFRAALRRTRSLLGQIKRVFPPDMVERFSTEFSWLHRVSGRARDIDALVLSLRAQREAIRADDMETLTAFLGRAQQREHQGLTVALDSEGYRRLISDWAMFLERSAPLHPGAHNAGRLLADVVAQRAWRVSRRIARNIETIDEHTPSARLHEVRLDANKLRYLVDVTQAFYDPSDLERLVKALKKVQRVLGSLNDAQLQERRLVECRRALAAAGGPQGTLLALGRLADQHRQRRHRLREQVTDGLSRFRSRGTRLACRRAFRRPEQAGDGI